MNDFLQRVSHLSPKQLALLAARLQEKLDAQDDMGPIACIGIGCRLPGGVRSPEDYWRLLTEGRDAIITVPSERWDVDSLYDADPDAAGKIASRFGGFLDDVDRFDAELFGISTREARSMDPQQRLLLEVAWESLERAGYGPDQLMGSATGVYFGISNFDYAILQLRQNYERMDAYVASGCSSAVAAGRLSYVLGLTGPSLTVDTACSSSLVATHLACQSLRAGECRMALAGGVNLILSPVTTIALSRAHMMAPDGRCKAFDAAADGFVRSEGVGVIVLKRLADALADGDPIVAVLSGSAINQDGRSNGLTAPSGPSQEAVIRAALRQAERSTADVGYVETHGTGTSLGDPIEIRALGHVFGPGRQDTSPLVVGSVKSNIGHCESAAGIAGLIKAMLVVQQGSIPRSLHYQRPNPHIEWSGLPVRVADRMLRWDELQLPPQRLAGVSSFGFGGTNAHVIVEQPPAARQSPPTTSGGHDASAHLLTFSAQSQETLRDVAKRWSEYLTRHPETSLAAVSRTTAVGRAQLEHRLALTATKVSETAAQLERIAAGEPAEPLGMAWGKVLESQPARVAFLFTGQGASRVHVGQTLYHREPEFRAVLDRCDSLFLDQLGFSIREALLSDGHDAGAWEQTIRQQPLLFALEYALACLWQSWGVRPLVVMGHSLGEYVAACVAGIIRLEDAVRLVAVRARAMQALPAGGAMLAVRADYAHVEPYVADYADRISVAACNGPNNTVISGNADAIDELHARFTAEGTASQRLGVSQAFHSHRVAPALRELEAALREVVFSPPQIDVAANLTGAMATGDDLASASYWLRHAREPVQFQASMQTLAEAGVNVFLEIGPQAMLTTLGRTCVSQPGLTWVTSLDGRQDGWLSMQAAVAQLFCRGVEIDWRAYHRARPEPIISGPTYPFRPVRYWYDESSVTTSTAAPPLAARVIPDPQSDVESDLLPGLRMNTAAPIYQAIVSHAAASPLFEHVVDGRRIATGFACLAAACSAARREFRDLGEALTSHLELHYPLVFPRDADVCVQTTLARQAGNVSFTIHSRPAEQQAAVWMHIASGSMAAAPALSEVNVAAQQRIEQLQLQESTSVKGDDVYFDLGSLGIELGTSQKCLKQIWRTNEDAWARLYVEPRAGAGTGEVTAAALDSALHAMGAWLRVLQPERRERLAFSGVETLTCGEILPGVDYWVQVTRRPETNAGVTFAADLRLFLASGRCVATLGGVCFRQPAEAVSVKDDTVSLQDCVYDWEWVDHSRIASAAFDQSRLNGSSVKLATPMDWRSCAPDEFHDAVTKCGEQRGLECFVAQTVPAIDDAALDYMHLALRQLAVHQDMSVPSTAEDLRARLAVVPRQARLFDHVLRLMASRDVLKLQSGRYIAGPRWNFAPTAPTAEGLRQFGAESCPETTLTVRCGENLAAVLRGQTDPVSLLFPAGDVSALTSIYATSPTAQVTHELLTRVVKQLIDQLPAGRTITILEIGAGTGATTASLMDLFPADRTRYVFTDVSPMFLESARSKFAAYPFVEFHMLDIETGASATGLDVRADLIVAANVLHATADLQLSLTHAAERLAENGRIVLVEGEQRHPWVDVTFGLTEGWWRFHDAALRPDYPLAGAEGWRRAFAATRFRDVETLPIGLAANGQADQRLWWATAPVRQIESSGANHTSKTPAARHWLVCDDKLGVGAKLATALEGSGCRCTLVRSDVEFQANMGATWSVAPLDAESWRRVIDEAVRRGAPFTDVAYCWSAADLQLDHDRSERTVALSTSLLKLVQTIQASGTAHKLRVHLITRGAQSQGDEAAQLDLDAACLWGLGRGIVAEHPDVWGQMIDLPSQADGSDAAAAARELLSEDDEDEISLRGGRRTVARWRRAALADCERPTLRADRSYLITGGLGGVGLSLARWLAECGARHVTLAARRTTLLDEAASDPRGNDLREKIAAIRAGGVEVVVRQADVGSDSEVRALLATFDAAAPPLAGVFHLAASIEPATVMALDCDSVRAMYRPKTEGALLLHEHTGQLGLDHFVLFSSTTARLGAAGLSHYAAANQYLDGLAHWRRAQGLPALVINWGTWSEMRRTSTTDQSELAAGGLLSLPVDDCLEGLGRAMRAGVVQTTIANIDWHRLKPLYEARRRRSILSDMSGARVPRTSDVVQATAPSICDTLSATRNMPAKQRRTVVETFLTTLAVEILGGAPPGGIDVDRGLFEMGMDSLMSVKFKSKLEAALAKPLPATLTFNYPTIRQLTEFLLNELTQAALETPAALAPDKMPAPVPTTETTRRDNNGGEPALPATGAGKLSAHFAERLRRLQ